MKLSDLMAPQRVLAPLGASTLRAGALALLERLVVNGDITDQERLSSRIEELRGEDIVSFGDRAFLAHFRTDAARELVIAIGVAREPIFRDAGEGEAQSARVVMLVVAPPRLAARYLQVLGAVGRLFGKAETVEQILAAGTPEAIASLEAFSAVELPPQLAVRDIMTERPRTARPDTLLREAAHSMLLGGVRALPVVDESQVLVGMLGERELLRDLLGTYLQGGARKPNAPGGASRGNRSVRDVMTRQVLCVSPDQPLAEVASLMSNKDVEQAPVVREGKLVGFLTRGDIVRKLIG